MAKTEPFEKNYLQYEEWFKNNKLVYQSELKLLKSLIPDNMKGIEIGIGSGLFAKPLGIKIGIEPSTEMRKLAVRRGLEVYTGIGEALPFEDNSFDFALLVTTICFLDNVEKTFKEIRRILHSGGFLLIAFVDKNSSLGKSYQKYKEQNIFYQIATFYSTEEVLTFLSKTGFMVNSIHQTIFGLLNDIHQIQEYKSGFGEGGFVVIKALKK